MSVPLREIDVGTVPGDTLDGVICKVWPNPSLADVGTRNTYDGQVVYPWLESWTAGVNSDGSINWVHESGYDYSVVPQFRIAIEQHFVHPGDDHDWTEFHVAHVIPGWGEIRVISAYGDRTSGRASIAFQGQTISLETDGRGTNDGATDGVGGTARQYFNLEGDNNFIGVGHANFDFRFAGNNATIKANGQIWTNQATATGPAGAVVGKVPFYDAAGALIGYAELKGLV